MYIEHLVKWGAGPLLVVVGAARLIYREVIISFMDHTVKTQVRNTVVHVHKVGT